MNLNLTLLGQMITFALFVWFTMKYVWPPLLKVMEERRKKIADGLAAAEQGQHDLELAKFKAKEIIHEAKAQASVIVEQANHRAHKIVEEAQIEAHHVSDRIKKQAQSEVEQQVAEARSELRQQVVNIALAGTEKLLRQNVDVAANKALLASLAEEI